MAEGNGRGKTPRAADPVAEGQAAGADCLAAALEYLSRGWPVLCCCPPDHLGVGREHADECDSPGKCPLHRWKEFQPRRPPGEEIKPRLPSVKEVREWWQRWPNANVGVALGDLVRIDVEGPLGEELLAEMSGGDLPPTLEFSSGREGGGRGLLYTVPAGFVPRTTIQPLAVGQELRLQANGAQTVLPPSRHKSGRRYCWVEGHGPEKREAEPAPAWLLDALRAPKESARERRGAPAEAIGDRILDGHRDTTLTSLAGSMRRRGMSEDAIRAALDVTNEQQCDPPLPPEQVAKIAHSVASYDPATELGGDVPPSDEPPRPVTVCVADVETQPVEWVWEYWIPKGTSSVLDGDPGLGKSTITADLAARETRGWAMPPYAGGVELREPRHVLLLSAEDDVARTIRPRLEAAGADLRLVHILNAICCGTEERPPVLPDDLDHIEEVIRDWNVSLVVIDPLMAYLSGDVNSHQDQDIRRVLHRVKILAERTGAAVLVVRHLNKLSGGPALYRGGGSIGIVGAARSALVVGRDPQAPQQRVLASNKLNLGPAPRSLIYSLESAGQVACVAWGGECDLTADEVLGQPGRRASEGKAEDCAEVLREALQGGPQPVKEIESLLKGMGYGDKVKRAARQAVGIKTFHDGGIGGAGVWMMRLLSVTEIEGGEDEIPD
jgi:hypothetical protein